MTLNKKAQEYYRLKDKHAKELAEFTAKYCGYALMIARDRHCLKSLNSTLGQSWKKVVLHLQDAE